MSKNKDLLAAKEHLAKALFFIQKRLNVIGVSDERNFELGVIGRMPSELRGVIEEIEKVVRS